MDPELRVELGVAVLVTLTLSFIFSYIFVSFLGAQTGD